MNELTLSTTKKQELIDITPKIENIVKNSKIKEGLCLVHAAHTTAAVIINENDDPNLGEDILNSLSSMVPNSVGYKHNCIDNNAAAHIKAAMLKPSETLIIHEGKLILGKWQSLMFCELDGPRQRRILVEILGK
jgi:secondary thiamine-phosphate synthase enzyme